MKSSTIKPITIREFVYRFMEDPDLFNFLPEFSFIKPVADKWKKQNCSCGLGPDIKKTVDIFNDFVVDLSPETVSKVCAYFSIDSACFAIQTPESQEVKCY